MTVLHGTSLREVQSVRTIPQGQMYPRVIGGHLVGRVVVLKLEPFFSFFGGCPIKDGLPKKGVPFFFQGHCTTEFSFFV